LPALPHSYPSRALIWAAAALTAAGLLAAPAHAEALIVIEAETGKVLHAENAGSPWYPASVTKIMTAYAVLRAARWRSSRSRWGSRPARSSPSTTR
jgi:D-alanyl-D-alanine carboxypeptidase